MKKGIKLLLASAIALSTGWAAAQADYPNRPIRMIIPLAAGSAVDNAARVVTQKMAENLGQQIVTENIAGSAGLIGGNRLARATPDGYTIGGVNDSVLTMIPHMYRMDWDPLRDYEPLSLVTTIEWGIVVKNDSPIKSVADLIAYAKANPDKLNYSSGGVGSPQHIGMELFSSRANVKLRHVPYRGATPAAVGVAAGEVDVAFQGLGTVTSFIQGNRMRLIAVGTQQRLPQFPDVPTIHESGLPNFYFNSWFAMVVPKGTPKPIVDRLYSEVQKALADKETRDKLSALGMTLRGTSPADMGEALRAQYAMYKKLIEDNNIQAE